MTASELYPAVPVWLTTKQLCARLRIGPSTARLWRQQGSGPAWAKTEGGLVRYRVSEVERWEAEIERRGAGERAGRAAAV